MKLIDLLSVIDEHTDVKVCFGEILERIVIHRYNGKDSIPDKLNDMEVVNVSISDNERAIEIWLKTDI